MKGIRTTLAFFGETTETELQRIEGGCLAPVGGPITREPLPIQHGPWSFPPLHPHPPGMPMPYPNNA